MIFGKIERNDPELRDTCCAVGVQGALINGKTSAALWGDRTSDGFKAIRLRLPLGKVPPAKRSSRSSRRSCWWIAKYAIARPGPKSRLRQRKRIIDRLGNQLATNAIRQYDAFLKLIPLLLVGSTFGQEPTIRTRRPQPHADAGQRREADSRFNRGDFIIKDDGVPDGPTRRNFRRPACFYRYCHSTRGQRLQRNKPDARIKRHAESFD